MADEDRLKDGIRGEPTMGFLILALRVRQTSNLATGVTGLSMGVLPGKTRGGGNGPEWALPLHSWHPCQGAGGQRLSQAHQQAPAWMRCVGPLF